jgi:hypothetical protein
MNDPLAHDYPVQATFGPNARALRGILAALSVTAFFCFCDAIALLPGLHPIRATAQAATRCSGDKACACCHDSNVPTAQNIVANPGKH